MLVKSIRLWRVVLPMKFDFRTAKGLVRERHTLVVEVETDRGFRGFGEVVAFDTPFYTAETIHTSEEWLRKVIPYFIGYTMENPWDCYTWECKQITGQSEMGSKENTRAINEVCTKDTALDLLRHARLPMAWAGLENALLHAFFEEANEFMIGSLVESSLGALEALDPIVSPESMDNIRCSGSVRDAHAWENLQGGRTREYLQGGSTEESLQGEHARGTLQGVHVFETLPGTLPRTGSSRCALNEMIPLGLVFGDMPISRLLDSIENAVAQGCKRVKIKLTPKDALERLAAVRAQFPNLELAADANRSFSSADWAMVKAFDEYNLKSLEEPFEVVGSAAHTYSNLPVEFWQGWQTPLSFDESVQSLEELKALHRVFSALVVDIAMQPILNVKIGRLGGLRETLRCIAYCKAHNLGFWIGSMVESGISKILHVELAALPQVWMAGDLSDSKRYFEEDLIIPPIQFDQGYMTVPRGSGLGVKVNYDILQAYGTIIMDASL
ncbi:enolase C-terminal domain-like protein [uncultured Veillonella sp.]|uniref:enolase C-terminal domain-like protein n=1 Tax=uncultured Veillonella sp. TaxID=159268 RepID=UPI0025DE93FC|nr:enolase C-terminal domain-like protein [uncultured Veillonella sp.]